MTRSGFIQSYCDGDPTAWPGSGRAGLCPHATCSRGLHAQVPLPGPSASFSALKSAHRPSDDVFTCWLHVSPTRMEAPRSRASGHPWIQQEDGARPASSPRTAVGWMVEGQPQCLLLNVFLSTCLSQGTLKMTRRRDLG